MVSGSSIIFDRLDFSSIFDKISSASILGVQIPDGLKFYAIDIANFLRERGFEVIFSGKATYGACDIDMELLREVDFLLHFAHTEMVNIDRVIYVPYRIEYDVDVELLKENLLERKIALIGTASYSWKFEKIRSALEKEGFEVELREGTGVEYPGQVLGCNYSCLKNTESKAVLFVGDGEFHPIGASLYSRKRVYAYSPLSNEIKEVNAEEFLKRRYLAVSKAMNCESFGILVSTKIGQKRLELAKELQRIALERGKTAEIILTDEINPSVTDNFRFDAHVNTACPRVTFDDYSRFGGKIISPMEFKIALGVEDFDRYSFEFSQ